MASRSNRRRWAYCGLALVLSAFACAVALLTLGAR